MHRLPHFPIIDLYVESEFDAVMIEHVAIIGHREDIEGVEFALNRYREDGVFTLYTHYPLSGATKIAFDWAMFHKMPIQVTWDWSALLYLLSYTYGGERKKLYTFLTAVETLKGNIQESAKDKGLELILNEPPTCSIAGLRN